MRECRRRRLGAIVLAAGRSSRMGGVNKLTVVWGDRALVCHPVDAALAAGFDPVVVVTGHEAERIGAWVGERPVTFAPNPAFAEGIAGSIATGVAALPDDVDGVVILLGDMPGIGAAHLRHLASVFTRAPEAIVVPTRAGRWGNPLLWPRRFFAAIAALEGDRGARALAERHRCDVIEVAMADDAVLTDFDTPEAFAVARVVSDPAEAAQGASRVESAVPAPEGAPALACEECSPC